MERYMRNYPMLSEQDQQLLHQAKVCVVGCGGLGGYILEMLGRLGIGHITAVDGDTFDESNLNRQILANLNTLGQNKALVAQKRMEHINPEIKVNPISNFLNENNAVDILKGHDVIIDALDKIQSRFILQTACEKLNIPFIYGAIAGWYGQISTIYPKDGTLDKIYKTKESLESQNSLGNPSFTPALVSSIQVSEVVKILINKGDLLRNKVLFIDTLNHEYEVVHLC